MNRRSRASRLSRKKTAVDVRGYGGSTLPPEMTAPADAAGPLVRIETAVRDLAAR